MRTSSKQTLGGKRLACFTAAWIAGSSPAMTEERTEERPNENVGGETPTDAIQYFAVASATAAPLSGEAHIYRRSTAVLAPRSLSSQGTQPQARLPGTWRGHVLRIPLSGHYPPLPVPVQRQHLALRS